MIYLNNKPVIVTIFPDNTSQVWKLPEDYLEKNYISTITWKFSNEGEFLQIAQLKDLLDSQLIESNLYIEYLPYARQDKPVTNTSTFALTTFAKLLNSLNFKRITILDPHSEIALRLINNSNAEYSNRKLNQILGEEEIDVVCYPDKGAANKYLSKYSFPQGIIFGEKVRDQQTGHITSYELLGSCPNKKVLIVDDICDYGRTFILLTKQLKEAGAKEVNLFVTHGLFSGGLQVLKDAGISKIFTKNNRVV